MCDRLLVPLVTILFLSAACKASDDQPARAKLPSARVTTKEIETQIDRLANSDFEVRRAATQRLIDIGPPAIALLKSAKNSDTEVDARIDVILRTIREKEGDRKLAEIIEMLRKNEQLYRRIDFVLRRSYRLVRPVQPRDTAVVLFSEELHRYVLQDDLFYVRRTGFGESHLHQPDFATGDLTAAYDGTRTRIRFAHKFAEIHEGRVEKTYVWRPHDLLSSSWLDRRYSEMLATKTFDTFKVDVEYLGTESVDGLECEKLRVETWPCDEEPCPKPSDATVGFVWLALERNYLPIKSTDDSDPPRVVNRVTEMREIAPDLWFPIKVEKKQMDWQRNIVSQIEEYETLRVRMGPDYDVSLFREVNFPYNVRVSEYKDGQAVRRFLQEEMFKPSTTNLSLQFVTTDDYLKRALRGLTQLKSLNLALSPVTDAGLAHLKMVPNLESLTLGSTQVEGPGLKHLACVPQLTSLRLGSTAVTDDSLVHLKGLRELRILELSHCPNIGDDGLAHLKVFPNIKTLDLRNCPAITDVGLTHVSQLKNLQFLVLDGSLVSDEGLKKLHQLRKLGLVSLKRCPSVTQAGVEELQQALPNCRVLVGQ